MMSPSAIMRTPKAIFAVLPPPISALRQRAIACLDTNPSPTSRAAAPSPKASMISATRPKRRALRRQNGGSAQRRANAGAPDRAEQEADAELSGEAARLDCADPLIRPVADRAAGRRQ